ncbi:heparin lyase I family protein [Sphingobium aromaticiconvertens]|uniref:heparin lyase I family protein n=1 Tax=Sphingobium aromaticiconvertens TaxID=365341 RepID=UPI0030177F57
MNARKQELVFQNGGAKWSVEAIPNGYRFEVRPGDQLAGDRAQSAQVRERSEAYVRPIFEFGQTYLISFQLTIPPGARNAAEWMSLMQIQSTFDPGEQGHSPPFGLYMKGEKMDISARYSPEEITPPGAFKHIQLYRDDKDIERGHPFAMKIRVRFDHGGKGAIEIWRDGRQLVSYQGPFGFNDKRGPYLKFGIYRAGGSEVYTAEFRDLSIQRLSESEPQPK